MFCATCFQKAEEGSKYCSTCRQGREGPIEGAAWSALPSTAAQPWSAPPHGAPAESESAVWTPPRSTERLSSFDVPAPPRAEVASPQGGDLAPDDLSNPFGEPSESDRLPSPPPLQPSAPPPILPQPEPLPVVAVSSPAEAPLLLEPAPVRGSKEISAILAAGLILLSVTTFAQALRQGPSRPAAASLPDRGAVVRGVEGEGSEEDGAAGERFLTSAQASLLSGDYEMAASQAQTARERLVASGNAAREAEARWVLARALKGKGKLEEAHSISLELYDSDHAKEAREMASALAQELRQQARALLASGAVDLEKGLLGPSLDKARRAESLFRRYGGSREQIAGASKLLASARRAEAGIGLDRPRSSERAPEASVRASRPQATSRPAARPQSRVASGSVNQPSRVPSAAIRPQAPSLEGAEERVDPANLPMMNQMRRRRGVGAEEAPMPSSASAPGEAPVVRPEREVQVRRAPVNQPRRETSSEQRRGRAGSNDVLPSYSNPGGGSVY